MPTEAGNDFLVWRDARRQTDHKQPLYYRTEAQRDADRILYSSAFRRLGGVTQVVAAREEGHLFHNRLTHSLKVAQLARRISQKLLEDVARSGHSRQQLAWVKRRGGLDPDVSEAAGLAHDLGHPPFGHIAETVLRVVIRDDGNGPIDGFEGNAQTFRVVTRLAAIDETVDGLNLTRATLNAILKYPWLPTPEIRKYGVYSTEAADFSWAREGLNLAPEERTLEAEIMDWADDIAYSVHDVEDFFRAGLIPLGARDDRSLEDVRQLLAEEWDIDHYGVAPKEDRIDAAVGTALALFPLSPPFLGTKVQRAELRKYSSQRINVLVSATSLGPSGLLIETSARDQVELLKQMTKYFVVGNAALATQQHGQREVIAQLYRVYRDALSKGYPATSIFPPRTRDEIEAASGPDADPVTAVRVVADVVAGMTEAQAIRVYHRLASIDFGHLLDPAVL